LIVASSKKKTAKKSTGKGAKKSATAKRQGRRAVCERNTSETKIRVSINLDGVGKTSVDTGVPFFDHMLDAFGRHSLIDLSVVAKGDTHIDDHHTVEDVGLALGQAIDEALGSKKGIVRFGSAEIPLDEALVSATVDLSGRPFMVYNMKIRHQRVGKFEVELVNDFLQAFMTAGKMNLHINKHYGRNPHHLIEAMFKALARAMKTAISIDPRVRGVPSTKGSLRD
jgi:imidazoleglycerol-phosphate dehydratase